MRKKREKNENALLYLLKCKSLGFPEKKSSHSTSLTKNNTEKWLD